MNITELNTNLNDKLQYLEKKIVPVALKYYSSLLKV